MKLEFGSGDLSEAFGATLQKHTGERHLVIIIGSPDPDAIASALAHRYIAEEYGIEVTLLAFAEVSHQENRALLKILDVDLTLYDEDTDLSGYTGYSIVDSQVVKTPIDDQLKGMTFISHVDHHNKAVKTKAEFVDIREDAGSASAIYTSYLAHIWPEGLPNDQTQLGTVLAHGIRTDTEALMGATQIDFGALTYLSPVIDRADWKKIGQQSVSPHTLDMIQKALANAQPYETFLLSYVGQVRPDNRDGIPQAADFLLRRAGTDTVLVFGVVEDQIDGSFRTASDTVDPDSFLKKTFGKKPEGGWYGGGRRRGEKGAFQIPLGLLADHPDTDRVCEMAREMIERRFLDAIGMNGPSKEPAT